MQILDSSQDEDLAMADGLAFQECGFNVGVQYTFQIDCRRDLEQLFGQMSLKTRQHVRLAERAYKVVPIDSPQTFVEFYKRTLAIRNLKSNIPLDRFEDVYSACHARNSGTIIAALDENNSPIAMTFLVWDERKMYYVISALRAPAAGRR